MNFNTIRFPYSWMENTSASIYSIYSVVTWVGPLPFPYFGRLFSSRLGDMALCTQSRSRDLGSKSTPPPTSRHLRGRQVNSRLVVYSEIFSSSFRLSKLFSAWSYCASFSARILGETKSWRWRSANTFQTSSHIFKLILLVSLHFLHWNQRSKLLKIESWVFPITLPISIIKRFCGLNRGIFDKEKWHKNRLIVTIPYKRSFMPRFQRHFVNWHFSKLPKFLAKILIYSILYIPFKSEKRL